MRHFSKAALIMGIGGLVSQCIPLVTAPVLTRLYSPESFGLFSSFFAIAAILAIPATLRLDLALLLPSSDAEAVSLASGVLMFATVFLGALTGIMVLTDSLIMNLSDLHPLGGQLALTPLMAWCIAIQGVLVGVVNRRRKYGVIALSNVCQQLVAAVSSVALGVVGMHAGGLIASRIGAFVSGGLLLGRQGARYFFDGWRGTLPFVFNLLRQYRQFPLFNVPYSISGLLSRDFPILALTGFGYTAIAGQFAIARMAATLPGNFLSSSLSNVFYREAVEHLGTEQFTSLTWKLSKALALVIMPPFLLLGLWGEGVFLFVFGENWRGAGSIFGYLALPFALSVLTGWPERVFEVRAKQQWSFFIQIGFDLLTVAGVLSVLLNGGSPTLAIKVYASIQIAYQLTYLAAVYSLAGFGWQRFLFILMCLAGLVMTLLASDFVLAHYYWFGLAQRTILLATISVGISLLGACYLIKIFRSESAGG